jgi:hypothetical protein
MNWKAWVRWAAEKALIWLGEEPKKPIRKPRRSSRPVH